MNTAAEIANELSQGLLNRLKRCIEEGYEIWHCWDEPIDIEDQVKIFGFVTFVKRHEKIQSKAGKRQAAS